MMQNIYLVELDEALYQKVNAALENQNLSIIPFKTSNDFLLQVDEVSSGCVITTSNMNSIDSIEFIQTVVERGISHSIVVIDDQENIPKAVKAIRAGAVDYINRNFTENKLRMCVNEMLQ
jgi:two-component system, LuxR family, response regulator FixJ